MAFFAFVIPPLGHEKHTLRLTSESLNKNDKTLFSLFSYFVEYILTYKQ